MPRSFQSQLVRKSPLKQIDVTPPDLSVIQQEDLEDAKLDKPYRVGIEIPLAIELNHAGQWDELPDGGRICRLAITCTGAKGIGLNYNNLQLPQGSDLFIYTPNHNTVIGSFTANEIPGNHIFATRPLYTDKIVVEYYEPAEIKGNATASISGLVYMYRGFQNPEPDNIKSISSSSCEVNVNCQEGQDWQNQKQGVVKIFTKVGSKYFYCTGTLVNNTLQDFSPLFLTAAHCSRDIQGGGVSSDTDYYQWIFYFNYEYIGCIPSGTNNHSIVGAQKLAKADDPSDIGSDFLLLKLNSSIPGNYNPYYCGWDAMNETSSNGVCIHHPNGDVKKISTYTTPTTSGTYGSTPDTHWVVQWASTANGHGVTEGGSSGSALFNQDGLVVGALTGGGSDCDHLTLQDMFGKVSYSWVSNGTDSSQQLKPWLDPGNTGILKMSGTFNENMAIADFTADTRIIPVGGSVNFQDLSAGKPTSWHWYFDNASPSESTVQNPSGIVFGSYGKMNIKLVAANLYNSDTIIKESYIDVRAVVSPNPSTGIINVLADVNNPDDVIIEVYDVLGKRVESFAFSGSASPSYSISLPEFGSIFLVKVIQGKKSQINKVLVIR